MLFKCSLRPVIRSMPKENNVLEQFCYLVHWAAYDFGISCGSPARLAQVFLVFTHIHLSVTKALMINFVAWSFLKTVFYSGSYSFQHINGPKISPQKILRAFNRKTGNLHFINWINTFLIEIWLQASKSRNLIERPQKIKKKAPKHFFTESFLANLGLDASDLFLRLQNIKLFFPVNHKHAEQFRSFRGEKSKTAYFGFHCRAGLGKFDHVLVIFNDLMHSDASA